MPETHGVRRGGEASARRTFADGDFGHGHNALDRERVVVESELDVTADVRLVAAIAQRVELLEDEAVLEVFGENQLAVRRIAAKGGLMIDDAFHQQWIVQFDRTADRQEFVENALRGVQGDRLGRGKDVRPVADD